MASRSAESHMEAPDKKAWGDFGWDVDLRRAYKEFGRKSLDETRSILIADPIRMHHFRYATDEVFNYYVVTLIDFLTSDESREEADFISTFLSVIKQRMEDRPETFRQNYADIKRVLDLVADRQDFYDGDPNIYESFSARRDVIDKLFSAYLDKQEN